MLRQPAALEAILDGGGWVKPSGLYRVADDFRAPSLGGAGAAAARAHRKRVVWASDWPHTPPHGRAPVDDDAPLPFRDIDTGALLEPIASWFPEEGTRRQAPVENPARLYGFGVLGVAFNP